MKKHWIEVMIHTIFWISTTWLIASSFSIQSYDIEFINGEEIVNVVRDNSLIYQLMFCILISALLFYVNTRIIYKLNQSNKKTALVYSTLSFLSALIVVYLATSLKYIDNVFPLPKQLAFGIVTFYFSISIAYSLANLWLDNLQRHQQLVLDKKQTELALLRNQLQPHFLFNALNNLLSMVSPSENPKLNASFDRLSQLLRYVIDETQKERVSITQEIEFLKNYIDLQLLRFSENEVTVDFKVIGDHNVQWVEPGLFITFVENAFKYGTEPEKITNIQIEFDLTQQDIIVFRIKNRVMLKYFKGNGTGIETTKKRLELIYSKNYDLDIYDVDGEFKVELKIKTAENVL